MASLVELPTTSELQGYGLSFKKDKDYFRGCNVRFQFIEDLLRPSFKIIAKCTECNLKREVDEIINKK